MPTWFVLLVKFLFYILCNILKKGNLSTFVSSHSINQPTNQQTNQAHNFSVLIYRSLFVLFQCLCCTIHSMLLHFLRHVSSYNNGFAFRYLGWPATIITTQTLKKIIIFYQKFLFSFMQKWQMNHAIAICNSSQLPSTVHSYQKQFTTTNNSSQLPTKVHNNQQ